MDALDNKPFYMPHAPSTQCSITGSCYCYSDGACWKIPRTYVSSVNVGSLPCPFLSNLSQAQTILPSI